MLRLGNAPEARLPTQIDESVSDNGTAGEIRLITRGFWKKPTRIAAAPPKIKHESGRGKLV